jgi:hypothetical protein
MDVLTDHVLILVQICLLSLIWDQVLMPLHLRLRVIYQALQVIWQVGQKDLHQVKADLRQVIWQVNQTDLRQVIWDQVIWGQVEWDQMDQWDLLQAIWLAIPLSIQPLEWRHNLLKVQVKVVTMMGQHP